MIIGITGGIASGKTFCTDYLASKYEVNIVDADLIAREVVDIGTQGLALLEAEFGPEIILESGKLDRIALRGMMLADPAVRKKLNAIIHPLVRECMLARLYSYQYDRLCYQIMSVPLLLENNLDQYVDFVVVIDVVKDIQIERLCLRDENISEKAARDMLSIQTNRIERINRANFLIDNNGTKQFTQRQLDQLHDFFCSLSDQKVIH